MMLLKRWRMMIAVCSFFVFYEFIWKIRSKLKKLPPGPSPIVAAFYVLKMYITKRKIDVISLNKELTSIYDKNKDGIFYQSTLGFNIVKITSSSMAKQVLNNKLALNRPIFGNTSSELHIESTADGTSPFANINGLKWEKRRKLSSSILFRMCTSKFVNKILNESIINTLFPELNKLSKSKQLWYPSSLMKYLAFNTVFYANYGVHISYKDKLYRKMVDIITETFQLFQSGIIYSFLPKYILFFVKLNPYSDYYRIINLIRRRSDLNVEFAQFAAKHNIDIVKKDPKTFQKKEAVYYIDYIQNELTESEVEADMSSLFGAGTDTTSSTLNFAVILSAKYPNIQIKIRNELINILNDNKKSDNNDLNDNISRFNINWINQSTYLRAYIHEVLRVASITKLGLPHCASADINIITKSNKQYCIPKGTIISYVIELMHKDNNNEHWVNSSNKMCLENWINSKTQKFELNESFLTFGYGRRDCVGRNLALKELYVIISYLLLNYSFEFKNKDDINKPIKTLFNGVNVIHPPIGVVVNRL